VPRSLRQLAALSGRSKTRVSSGIRWRRKPCSGATETVKPGGHTSPTALANRDEELIVCMEPAGWGQCTRSSAIRIAASPVQGQPQMLGQADDRVAVLWIRIAVTRSDYDGPDRCAAIR
jgi:hypothetical protein